MLNVMRQQCSTRFSSCVLLCLGASGSMLAVGCHGGSSTVLGTAPADVPTGTVVQTAHLTRNAPITLRGEMVEKCPVAGCWFKLRDKTGVVRVDTKAAGFVVTDVPLHAQLLIQGRVDAQGGVAATGVRY